MQMYNVSDDILLIQDLLGCSREDLALATGISKPTINRWVANSVRPNQSKLNTLYNFAYKRGLRLNAIKEQFYHEENAEGHKVLFHGAKHVIEGDISPHVSREHNDFGRGFYCGESYQQAAMFVSNFDDPSVYALSFCDQGLTSVQFGVNRDWMLCVSLCRGKLKGYEDSPLLLSIAKRLNAADYLVAPIADNRMFQILDEFADGEITDEQCLHSLSATDLGMQYVIKTARAAECLRVLERCFLCELEKTNLREEGRLRAKTGKDKARVARRKYRGTGRYVEELLDARG